MRTLSRPSLVSTLLARALLAAVLLAACGDGGGVPGRGADLASAPADATTILADLATAPDLAASPDLARAPDLATDPGGMCGGFGGIACPGNLFCDYPMHCGGGDESGTCRVKPQICPDIYDPVCGCDGKEYGNDCDRQGAGVSRFNRGICGCKDQCGVGKHCAQCKGGAVCLPDGAVC